MEDAYGLSAEERSHCIDKALCDPLDVLESKIRGNGAEGGESAG